MMDLSPHTAPDDAIPRYRLVVEIFGPLHKLRRMGRQNQSTSMAEAMGHMLTLDGSGPAPLLVLLYSAAEGCLRVLTASRWEM